VTARLSLCRADLGDGEMRRVVVDGRAYAVYRLGDDHFVTDDGCTHARASLTDGSIDGGCVVCPVHAGSFDIRTGRAERFPARVDLRTHAATVVDGEVTIAAPAQSSSGTAGESAGTGAAGGPGVPVAVLPPSRPAPWFDADRYVDVAAGTVDRHIFWDETIYQRELEQIFARCWLLVGHESQIPAPGDYLTTAMGEDQVIVVRQSDGSIVALINSCPHRGNRVCHADFGNTESFVCSYHGWAFNRDGSLAGVHEENAFRRDPNWRPDEIGLPRVAQVDTYKGLVFATFDADAPPLRDYLGEFCWYLDVMLDADEAGTEFLPGVLSSVLECNWKIAAENFVGDALHAGWTHDSAARAIFGGPVKDLADGESYQASVDGHSWEFNLDEVGNAATLADRRILQYLRSRRDEVEARLGPLRARMVGSVSSVGVFPNFSFLPGQQTFRTWAPLGPTRTRLTTWVLVNRSAPPEVKEAYRKGVMLTFSPAGVFEMDDGENWEQSTLANRGWVTRHQRLHYGLGRGTRIEHDELPGVVHRGQVNEANQRLFYARWAALMRGPSLP